MRLSKKRLYLIGLAMGMADLMPGISGGTIAFITGVYEKLLESIKNLHFQAFKKIDWPFLLPLGGGIATAIFMFSKLIYFFLHNFKAQLLGFIFGLITASILFFARKAHLYPHNLKNWLALILGGIASYWWTSLSCNASFETHFLWILLAGSLGVGGMLLPGISGSYILQMIGVYPVVMEALNNPSAPSSLKVLIAIGLGITLGFIIFSRLISLVLKYFYSITVAFLLGLMVGGLQSIWPFEKGGSIAYPTLYMCLGFVLVILLQTITKKSALRAQHHL